jgi:hypothetical protein
VNSDDDYLGSDEPLGRESEPTPDFPRVDHIDVVGKRADVTELAVTGDNLDQELSIRAGERVLDAYALTTSELRVAVPNDLIQAHATVQIVSRGGRAVGMDLSDIGADDSAGSEQLGTGLGGEGDTDF